MDRPTILKKVQARMSDLMPGTQIEVNSQSLSDVLLDDCADTFYMRLPTNVLPATDFSNGTASSYSSDEVLVKRLLVPSEFIRLVSFKVSDWRKSVNTTIPEGSDKHKLQFSKYTYGGKSRPVVTLVSGSSNDRNIEYYLPLGSTATVTTATCVVKGSVELMPDTLIDAFTWYVASVVLLANQEVEAAKAASSKVDEFIALHQQ